MHNNQLLTETPIYFYIYIRLFILWTYFIQVNYFKSIIFETNDHFKVLVLKEDKIIHTRKLDMVSLRLRA